MKLNNDRWITISAGNSRRDTNWRQVALPVSDFYERLRTPVRSVETVEEYLKLPKAQQDDLKDVGGFVGGQLNGGRRKAAAMVGRDLITLDFDAVPVNGTDDLLDRLDDLHAGYAVYSTRKHMDHAPRLRVILPLDRTVQPDEYEAIARRAADLIGISMCDPTTFEAERLMYWPSCCSDSRYVFQYADRPFLNADAMLKTYADWTDFASWPQVPGAVSYQKLAVQQGDPEAKTGVVGAFCRTYDIPAAMDTFLPGIYQQTDTDPNRYTYLNGSTVGGAIVYDSGKFLYSHHATDPCSGRLVNAFDLVRLHLFSKLDDSAVFGAPTVKLPSYKAMVQKASEDAAVSALLIQERHEEAVADFKGIGRSASGQSGGGGSGSGAGGIATPPVESAAADWMQQLRVNPQTGQVLPTIDNILIILDNDPLLKGKIAMNEFAARGEVLGALPWNPAEGRRAWSDTDLNGAYWYMERIYNITKRGAVDSALDIHSNAHAFNDVVDYLTGLVWDGEERLDTMLIDYLGAEDSRYTRAVTRKTFTAAVARALHPGCKFDNMLFLCGPQGIGKSTLFEWMSKGWFSNSLSTFEGKEASEHLRGVWIIEIQEMVQFGKTDASRIKQFLSMTTDRYRAAYGRNVQDIPRRCIFCGTSNKYDVLQDTTGNRRFWPVDCERQPHARTVRHDLTPEIIDQMWAEAVVRYTDGEELFLSDEIEREAFDIQEGHRETDQTEGIIRDFLSRPVPTDWDRWSTDRRSDYWAGGVPAGIQTVSRTKVCALEIWLELYHGTTKDFKKSNAREINGILEHIDGWSRYPKVFKNGPYGDVRGFKKDA